MAVDLAKLSLWLATMARDHPFTFLDHAIKCGDSLVGLTNKQIAAFHWDLSAAKERVFGQEKLEQQIAKVAAFRKEILQDPEDTEFAVLRKQAKLAEADSAARSLKTTGDLVIAAFFAGEKPKERQQLRDEFLHRHLELQKGENIAENLPWQVQTLNHLKGISSPSSLNTENCKLANSHPIRPFHWEIEFPEVFSRENPGFDAIVGNPPFLGGARIWPAFGPGYPDWLRDVHTDSDGKGVDLVAHFFRRSVGLVTKEGCFGLIASKTICQGDTRAAGLKQLAKNGVRFYSAIKRVRWPGEAAVIVSIIHCSRSSVIPSTELDGKLASGINSFLLNTTLEHDVEKLKANKQMAFRGSDPYGKGFIFTDEADEKNAGTLTDRIQIITKNPKNSERIFPYIGGQEIVTHPSHAHHRYAINFERFSLSEASAWPDLLAIVRDKVKPDRDLLGGYNVAEKRKELWWQYGTYSSALHDAIRNQSSVLVIPRHTSYIAFAFLPSQIVLSDKAVVLPAPHGFRDFSLVQSRAHELWALFWGTTLGETPVYSVPECLQTFPFPSDWETNEALEEAGRAYYEFRAALMIRNDEGLTKTYNRFHDPEEPSQDIRQLRELHAAMDRAVLDAYGWTDIPTACQFLLDYEEEDEADEASDPSAIHHPRSTIKRRRRKPWRYRWPDDIRDEVLARLLALNAERAAQEKLSGTSVKKSAAKKSAKKAMTTAKGTLAPTVPQRANPAKDEMI